jgi:Alkylmercury lyase
VTLPPFEQRVRLHVMDRILLSGRAPTVAETARALGAAEADAAEAFQRLAEDHAVVLAPGTLNVWMANPLSVVPTGFPVTVAGRRHFGNCIWDALGIVAMLAGPDGDGEVTTWCPDCAAPLTFGVVGGRPDPSLEAVAHFAVPAARWWENIGFT